MHLPEFKQAWAELTAPGAPFEVEQIEVRGTRLRAYKKTPPSVREFWLSTAVHGERDYLVYQDERITYAQAHFQVAAVANWLIRHGVKPGDRVAIAMRNYPEWMLIYWACTCVGVAAVGINAWWVAEELEYALKDSAPKVVFCDQERLDRIMARPRMAEGMQLVGVRTESMPYGTIAWDAVVAQGGPLPDVKVDPDADACIFYTSGTTGHPKGAQLTHRGCLNNLFNIMFSAQVQALTRARSTGVPVDASAPTPTPVVLVSAPLFHVTGSNGGAYRATAAGAKLVLMYRWEAGQALKLIEREKVTFMSGVPVMARELIDHPDFSRTDTSSLLSLGGGGAALTPDLATRIDEQVPTARPFTGYGMTEVSGMLSSLAGDLLLAKPASCGPALPNFETRYVDDHGRDVAAGAIGELWVKGAPVIKGYINRPEATAESITDGWLHTGDVARVDGDGFIFLVDRKKDMVLRGGENVYCAEVEASVYHHPSVAECCVFGVPDARLGEEVAAAVVLRHGHALTAEALREHCASRLARYKVPRYLWLLDDPIPRNASGKFLKRHLRDTLTLETALRVMD